jgi:hypothetical protein
MPTHLANMKAAQLARAWGFEGRIGAAVKFSDEAEQLATHGVDAVFNIYDEAGSGFAEHAEYLFTSDVPSSAEKDQRVTAARPPGPTP